MRQTRLGPRALKILAAISWPDGLPPTVRDLCAASGLVSPNGVASQLKRLRRLRLIEWESVNGHMLARSIRVTFRFIPEEEIP